MAYSVIGFNASPRKNGNTAWSIQQILESAAEPGKNGGTAFFNISRRSTRITVFLMNQT